MLPTGRWTIMTSVDRSSDPSYWTKLVKDPMDGKRFPGVYSAIELLNNASNLAFICLLLTGIEYSEFYFFSNSSSPDWNYKFNESWHFIKKKFESISLKSSELFIFKDTWKSHIGRKFLTKPSILVVDFKNNDHICQMFPYFEHFFRNPIFF